MYFIEINSGDEKLVKSYGDFPTVAYLAGKTDFSPEREYSVSILRVPRIDDHTDATEVVKLTSDGETVAIVLKAKVSTEKKALGLPTPGAKRRTAPADATPNTDGTVPAKPVKATAAAK
jgi:hypothetical protein